MKPLKQKAFLFLALFFFQALAFIKAEAGFVSWSGLGRLEAFYKKDYYADFLFAFQTQFHINDSLSFQTRFDLLGLKSSSSLKNFGESLVGNSALFHQRGYEFLSSSSDSKFPFVQPTQFYLDYKSEFFKVRIGRAPYHFGLGTHYFATNNPFDLWMSLPDQISVFFVYNNFYLQPSLFYKTQTNKKSLSALLQGGIEEENWDLAFLYEYQTDKDSPSFIEAYGKYTEKNWNLKSSLSYLFQSENSFALSLEAFYKLSTWKIPIDLQLKTGALNKEASFHPQYYLSHFLQDPLLQENVSGSLQNAVYFSPFLSFFFLEESLKVQPKMLLTYFFREKKNRSDFYLSGAYKIKDNLFFNLQAGAIYQTEWNLALLAQAAVSF